MSRNKAILFALIAWPLLILNKGCVNKIIPTKTFRQSAAYDHLETGFLLKNENAIFLNELSVASGVQHNAKVEKTIVLSDSLIKLQVKQ